MEIAHLIQWTNSTFIFLVQVDTSSEQQSDKYQVETKSTNDFENLTRGQQFVGM